MRARELSLARMLNDTQVMMGYAMTDAAAASRLGLRYVAGRLAEMGFGSRTRIRPFDGGDVLDVEVGSSDAPVTVTWGAHVDVVPAAPNLFNPRLVDGQLVGRGGYDMLGAASAMVETLPLVPAAGRGRVNVRLALSANEEGESPHPFGGYIAELVERGLAPDFVIMGEPTDLQVARALKGSLWVRVTVHGVGGHSSVPFTLSNPILVATRLAQQIAELPFTRDSSLDYPHGPSVTPTGFVSGGGPGSETTIPDTAHFVMGVRVIPGQSNSRAFAQIHGLVERTIREMLADEARRGLPPRSDPTSAITLQASAARESYAVPAQNGYVQALCRVVRPCHPDDAPVLRVQHGAGDLSYIGAIPGVEFGPRGGRHHSPEEWLDITSLVPYAHTLLAHVGLLADRSLADELYNHATHPKPKNRRGRPCSSPDGSATSTRDCGAARPTSRRSDQTRPPCCFGTFSFERSPEGDSIGSRNARSRRVVASRRGLGLRVCVAIVIESWRREWPLRRTGDSGRSVPIHHRSDPSARSSRDPSRGRGSGRIPAPEGTRGERRCADVRVRRGRRRLPELREAGGSLSGRFRL